MFNNWIKLVSIVFPNLLWFAGIGEHDVFFTLKIVNFIHKNKRQMNPNGKSSIRSQLLSSKKIVCMVYKENALNSVELRICGLWIENTTDNSDRKSTSAENQTVKCQSGTIMMDLTSRTMFAYVMAQLYKLFRNFIIYICIIRVWYCCFSHCLSTTSKS